MLPAYDNGRSVEMKYPTVMDELSTLHAANERNNLARYGDGELRLCTGGSAISQDAHPALAAELREILTGRTRAIPCIPPHRPDSPRAKFWTQYWQSKFVSLYMCYGTYGSSWVTRPDSAPWIDTTEYWELVAKLWRGKHVLFFTGGDSLFPDILREETEGYQFKTVPKKNAYAEVDNIVRIAESYTGEHDIVLLACGAAATVAAHRLAAKGVHAVDIGHMSMFLTVKGAYQMDLDQLASPYYRSQLDEAHNVKKWGTGGYSHVPMVYEFAVKLAATSILDYGCGRGTFKKTWNEQRLLGGVIEYDPGIPGKDVIPKPADLVVCTDVLEHVEPELIDNVLKHIHAVGRKGAYFVIATKPSNKVLPDGRNSHLIQQPLPYWKEKIDALGYANVRYDDGRKHITVWATK